jgi:uncharacterized protein
MERLSVFRRETGAAECRCPLLRKIEENTMTKSLFSAVLAGTALLAAGASAQTYSIGTNPQGSLFYASGAAISKVMVERTNLQFRVEPYAGSSTYMPLIHTGRLAFGMANAAEAAFAYSGAELFRQGHPNIRQVAYTFGTNSAYLVPMDSPIKTVADLKGKRVPVGYTSGRIFHFLSSAALATAGMTESDLDGVPTPNFVAGAKLLMAGRVDAAYVPLNTGIGKQADATIRGGVRYLQMDCNAEAAMDKALPTARVGKARPGSDMTGVVEDPTCFVNVPFTLVTGVHVPEEVVYQVVMTLHNHMPDLVATMVQFGDMDVKDLYQNHPNPYHPGAIRAYKELGLLK